MIRIRKFLERIARFVVANHAETRRLRVVKRRLDGKLARLAANFKRAFPLASRPGRDIFYIEIFYVVNILVPEFSEFLVPAIVPEAASEALFARKIKIVVVPVNVVPEAIFDFFTFEIRRSRSLVFFVKHGEILEK